MFGMGEGSFAIARLDPCAALRYLLDVAWNVTRLPDNDELPILWPGSAVFVSGLGGALVGAARFQFRQAVQVGVQAVRRDERPAPKFAGV